jgi:hypothetical protein
MLPRIFSQPAGSNLVKDSPRFMIHVATALACGVALPSDRKNPGLRT